MSAGFNRYLQSAWKETGSFERLIMVVFLTLGAFFLLYMAFRLISSLITS